MSKPEHVSVILEQIIDRFAEGKDPATGQLTRDEALDLKSRCDVCGKHRAHGNHQACSRARQERYRAMRETESVQQGAKQ